MCHPRRANGSSAGGGADDVVWALAEGIGNSTIATASTTDRQERCANVSRMPTRGVCAFLTIIVWATGFTQVARAGQGLVLGADVIFYGDNTEFRNPFREGETIFGAAARLDGRVEISESVTLSLGVFGNQRF